MHYIIIVVILAIVLATSNTGQKTLPKRVSREQNTMVSEMKTNVYLEDWKKYAVFSGRARRLECWAFSLINMVIALLIYILFFFIPEEYYWVLFVFLFFFSIIAIAPGTAVMARRLHDTNRSGWYLIGFIPIIGGLILYGLMFLDSDLGENRYGLNPKNKNSEQKPTVAVQTKSTPHFDSNPGEYQHVLTPNTGNNGIKPVPAVDAELISNSIIFCEECGAKTTIKAKYCKNAE